MSKRSKRFIVSAVVVALMAGLVPPRAEADWDDQSGGLPGITSGKTMVIIGAAAAAGVVALYLFKRKAARKTQPVADPATEKPQEETKAARWPAGIAADDVVRVLRADPRFAGLFQNCARSHALETSGATAE